VVVRAARWVRTEIPFSLVFATLLVAVLYLVVEPGRWGRSSGGVSVALLLAGLLRAVIPTSRVGLLAVRGRVVDSLSYLILGAVILAVDIRLHS